MWQALTHSWRQVMWKVLTTAEGYYPRNGEYRRRQILLRGRSRSSRLYPASADSILSRTCRQRQPASVCMLFSLNRSANGGYTCRSGVGVRNRLFEFDAFYCPVYRPIAVENRWIPTSAPPAPTFVATVCRSKKL